MNRNSDNEASPVEPEGWGEAMARADADHEAGRLIDGADLSRRALESLARAEHKQPTRAAESQ